MKLIDETGKRYGRLTVIAQAPNLSPTNKNTRWECRCECGKTSYVQGAALRQGRVVSCGCYHRESMTRHGLFNSPEYKAWIYMKARCFNQTHKHFQHYGGRGITVCERWMKFENFHADMGKKPKGTSLDRIDNNGNYEPSNCRWAGKLVQANNKRSNHILSFAGVNRTIAEWARHLGILELTLRSRLRLGWPVERALTAPVNPRMARNKTLH